MYRIYKTNLLLSSIPDFGVISGRIKNNLNYRYCTKAKSALFSFITYKSLNKLQPVRSVMRGRINLSLLHVKLGRISRFQNPTKKTTYLLQLYFQPFTICLYLYILSVWRFVILHRGVIVCQIIEYYSSYIIKS